MLQLTKAAYDAIRAHGEESYPAECCGALLGRLTQHGWAVTGAMRTDNASTDSAHNRYSIAPRDLIRIEKESRRAGLAIAGFYHSHPDHPAEWSSIDLAEAHWLGCSYVITSVEQGTATTTRSFLLAGESEEEKRLQEEAFQVLEES